MQQVHYTSPQAHLHDFYDEIMQDSHQSLIHLVSEAGQGKTSSLRSIIQYIKSQTPDIVFKIFDCSQAWYHKAPVQHRQLVTAEKVLRGQVANLDNCVYEIGSMSKEHKREFLGRIMELDFAERYQAKIEGRLDEYPLICFVMEEADIYFGSYSFRKTDTASAAFQNFSSVGRNYKMRGFLISTASQGEIAPSLRRRTRKIYGRLVSKGDLQAAKRHGVTQDLSRLPRYSFVYNNRVQRIPDTCTNTPQDYIVQAPVHTQKPQFDNKWYMTFFGTLGVFWLFWSFLMKL